MAEEAGDLRGISEGTILFFAEGCTADFCIADLCQRTNMDGINCNDDNPCTTDDACASGTCQGVERDCSDFDGQCVVGACNPATVECEPVPRQDGTSCEDGLSCTVGDACDNGSCSGKLLYCDDNDCDGKTDAADIYCWERVCNQSGWCWENPLPQGNGLMGIWGFSPNDVWMVGWYGTALHWDGVALTKRDTGTPKTLYDVWGTSADDVWAVGYGTLIHYNGAGWSAVESGSGSRMADIWGTTDGNIWIAGGSGNILRHQ